MNGGWNNRAKNVPSNIDKIISEARVGNCWIYIQSLKAFYTPEELDEAWDTLYKEGNKTNNFSDFKIVTPMYAIRLASQWVNVANAKLQEIIDKSNKYNTDFKIKKK